MMFTKVFLLSQGLQAELIVGVEILQTCITKRTVTSCHSEAWDGSGWTRNGCIVPQEGSQMKSPWAQKMCWASGRSKIKDEQHNQHIHDVDNLPRRFWRMISKRVTFLRSPNGALGLMSVDMSCSTLFFASLRAKTFQACSNAGSKPIFWWQYQKELSRQIRTAICTQCWEKQNVLTWRISQTCKCSPCWWLWKG